MSLREGDSSVYRRDFDRGTVLLNYTNSSQSVALGSTLHRPLIPGSPVFDGTPVTVETVPPSDARFLLTDPQSPGGTPPPAPLGSLFQNQPNPFNPRTQIRFDLRRGEHVRLGVYDLSGHLVRVLVDRPLPAGTASVVWDGRDRFTRPVRSGIYLYRITTPSFSQTRKMTLVQ